MSFIDNVREVGCELADIVVNGGSYRYGAMREGAEFVGRLERLRYTHGDRGTTVVIARGATKREARVRLDARVIATVLLRAVGASSVVVTWDGGHVETVEKKARR